MKKKRLKERIKTLEWLLKESKKGQTGEAQTSPQITVTTMLIESIHTFATPDIISEFPLQSATEQIKQLAKDKELNLNYFICECSGCYTSFLLSRSYYNLEDITRDEIKYYYGWGNTDTEAKISTLKTNFGEQDQHESKQVAIIAALLETGTVFCFQAKEDHLDYLKVLNTGNNLTFFEKYKKQGRFPKVVTIKLEYKTELSQILKKFSGVADV